MKRIPRSILRAIFIPSERGKTRWMFLFIVLVTLASASASAPAMVNRGIAFVNPLLKQTVKREIPKLPERPYRLGLDLQGGAHLVYEANMKDMTGRDRGDALEGVRDVIERRVNAFGVSEPIVQTTTAGDHYRVVVELAGVNNVNAAIKMIGETPLLEFKEENPEKMIPLTEQEKKDMNEYNVKARVRAEQLLRMVYGGQSDFLAFIKKDSEDAATKDSGGDLGFIGKQGSLLSAHFSDVEKTGVGKIIPKVLQTPEGYNIVRIEEARDGPKEGDVLTKEYRLRRLLIKTKSEQDVGKPADPWKQTGLSGKQLARAEVQFNQTTGVPNVGLQFNDEGKKLFAEITKRNVDKFVAIFLDGYPISIPRVQEEISGGEAVITGSFDIREAKLLAQRLNAGALPVPITLLAQTTVGATLGDASVAASLRAAIIGFLAIILFMILYYRFPGLLATLALSFYVLIVLAIFKLWPVTLTLAGIAGFVLSMGMAVDANVLIFERMKEELKRGRSIAAAMEEGFRRAWPSIRDGNVTTLLTCVILATFSTSIVKGFAITLAIGVLMSMVSALFVTKNLLYLAAPWVQRGWWYGVTKISNSKSQIPNSTV